MRIGEDTIFGRIALALEGIFKKVSEVPVATKKRSLLWCNGTDVVPAIVS